MRLDPIKIVDYDPSWPGAFEREAVNNEGG